VSLASELSDFENRTASTGAEVAQYSLRPNVRKDEPTVKTQIWPRAMRHLATVNGVKFHNNVTDSLVHSPLFHLD
jgi:hypothetical protein